MNKGTGSSCIPEDSVARLGSQ